MEPARLELASPGCRPGTLPLSYNPESACRRACGTAGGEGIEPSLRVLEARPVTMTLRPMTATTKRPVGESNPSHPMDSGAATPVASRGHCGVTDGNRTHLRRVTACPRPRRVPPPCSSHFVGRRGVAPRSLGLQPGAITRLAHDPLRPLAGFEPVVARLKDEHPHLWTTAALLEPSSGIEPELPVYETGARPSSCKGKIHRVSARRGVMVPEILHGERLKPLWEGDAAVRPYGEEPDRRIRARSSEAAARGSSGRNRTFDRDRLTAGCLTIRLRWKEDPRAPPSALHDTVMERGRRAGSFGIELSKNRARRRRDRGRRRKSVHASDERRARGSGGRA